MCLAHCPIFKRAECNNLLIADWFEKCGAQLAQLTGALDLSVVGCSALLRWDPKRLDCCLSSPLRLGLFGHIRALLPFKSWKMSPLRLFCGLLVGHPWAVKGWMGHGSHPEASWPHVPVPPEQPAAVLSDRKLSQLLWVVLAALLFLQAKSHVALEVF